MRRAKIVCTLGPKTSSPKQLRAIVDAGMDVARLNLSHGEHTVHEQVYRDVRKRQRRAGRAVGILVDLQGPKIRTGRFADGPITLAAGPVHHHDPTTSRRPQEVGTTYKGLPRTSPPATAAHRRRQGALCARSTSPRPTSSPRRSSAASSRTTRASTCPASP